MFYKIFNSTSPQYLFKLIPGKTSLYVTRNADNIPLFNTKNQFFLSYVDHWVEQPRSWPSQFRKFLCFQIFVFFNILKFIRPKPSGVFNCCNLKGIRLITWLRLELSHLRQHKFKYKFQNCLNPLCSCDSSIESTSHFLLHCPIFHFKRHTLLSTLNNIDFKVLESIDSYLTQTLLFGCASLDSETNTLVLNTTIDFILSTERFKESLF